MGEGNGGEEEGAGGEENRVVMEGGITGVEQQLPFRPKVWTPESREEFFKKRK